jgi:hypothetical protein
MQSSNSNYDIYADLRRISGLDLQVALDVTHAHFWDITAVYALDKAAIKLRNMGKMSK